MASRSPDLTPYIDLTLFDRDAEGVFETFLSDVRSRLPGYQPAETNTEIVVAQSLALEIAEEIFAINRLPGATMEGVLRLLTIDLDNGDPPTAAVRFTLGDGSGHTIPGGTRAALVLDGGREPIVFTTDVDLTVPEGQTSGVVAATGDRLTSEVNGDSAGALLQLLDAVAAAETVTLDEAPAGGRDPEATETWLSRGVGRFNRLSGALSLPHHFAPFLVELGAFRATAVDAYNPDDPIVSRPGDDPGHITVYVYGADDVSISDQDKAEMLAAVVPLAAPHLLVHIADPQVTTINITATVARSKGFDDATVIANAEAAVQAFLSPDRWPWTNLVRRTQIIGALSDAEGVAYVTNVTTPAEDLVLSGTANLTRAGTITVSVVAAEDI